MRWMQPGRFLAHMAADPRNEPDIEMLPTRRPGACAAIRELPNGDFATMSTARGLSVANDIIGDLYLLGDTSEK